jgi:hypothetical protein
MTEAIVVALIVSAPTIVTSITGAAVVLRGQRIEAWKQRQEAASHASNVAAVATNAAAHVAAKVDQTKVRTEESLARIEALCDGKLSNVEDRLKYAMDLLAETEPAAIDAAHKRIAARAK